MVKRQKRKINRIAKYFYLTIAILMIIFSISSIYNTVFSNNINIKKTYTYDSSFNLKYNVNLVKDNILIKDNIIDPNNLPIGSAYITDLIDNLDMNIAYNYKNPVKGSINYTYGITAVLNGTYTDNGSDKEVLNKQYTLLEPQNGSSNSGNIAINQDLNLNVKDYNDQIKLFEQTLNMKLKANLMLLFKVNIQTTINGKNFSVDYISNVKINLGDKTTEILGNLNDTKSGNLESTENANKQIDIKFIALDAALLLAGASLIIYVLTKTSVVNIMKNVYKLELNKILRICQDKIVQVSSPIQVKGEELVEVKDFQEIIKLSEELAKPILCYISKQEEEALFAVITNGALYRYILKGA